MTRNERRTWLGLGLLTLAFASIGIANSRRTWGDIFWRGNTENNAE